MPLPPFFLSLFIYWTTTTLQSLHLLFKICSTCALSALHCYVSVHGRSLSQLTLRGGCWGCLWHWLTCRYVISDTQPSPPGAPALFPIEGQDWHPMLHYGLKCKQLLYFSASAAGYKALLKVNHIKVSSKHCHRQQNSIGLTPCYHMSSYMPSLFLTLD